LLHCACLESMAQEQKGRKGSVCTLPLAGEIHRKGGSSLMFNNINA